MEKIDRIKIKVTREKYITEDYWLLNELVTGLVVVQSRENELYGVIDKEGNVVVPCEYNRIRDFSEGLAILIDSDDKCGVIDENGNVVVPCKYVYVGNFSEGLAAVEKNGKWGFIDKNDNEVIPCKYEDVESFSEGLAPVAIKKINKKLKYGFVNKHGKMLIPCKYDFVRNFSEGLAAVEKNGKWGFIDKDGNEVAHCRYKKVENFSEGLALVKSYKPDTFVNYYGFIDKEGNEVIPCEYDYAESFENGLAFVVKGVGECFYIDKKENRVEPCFEDSNTINSDVINYGKVVTEELYISNEKQLPYDCLSLEILAYNSLLVLNNGDRVEIEEPTIEKCKKEVAKIIEHELSSLENNINSTFARTRSIK